MLCTRPAVLLAVVLSAVAALASTSRNTITSPMGAQTEVAFDLFSYTGRDLARNAATTPPLPAGHYRNPVLAGFFPDPSVCRVGDDYYLVNSTFGYFPGLPIFHSRDLVNWRPIGHAINRPSQLNYRGIGVSQGLFAPSIEHHKGVFYLVCTMIGGTGNFVITAKDPAGPWSDPVWLDVPGIDPSLFFDDDGRAWLVHNGDAPENKPLYQGHRAVWLREFDPATQRIIGEPVLLVNGGVDIATKPVWIEGPHLFKKDGWYYLTCAEGGTGTDHSQVILRSRSVTGPFTPWSGNPILTQRGLDATAPGAITCTGHADLVIGPDGNWWSVFLGCRPFAEGKLFTTGRETFLLPVTWTADGWPVILPKGERVPLIAPGPASVAPKAIAPLNGDFTWTEDFKHPVLDPLWVTLRTPNDKPDWRVDTAAGQLLLTPGNATLAGTEHPALLARRVQHARFAATGVLKLAPEPGVAAGLTFFQNEKHHYFLAAERTKDGSVNIFVELADGGAPTVIHRAPAPKGDRLWLRMLAEGNTLTLFWSANGTKWESFAPPAGVRPVTVEAAGGGIHFTGAVVGLHARTTAVAQASLKEAYQKNFRIGTALNTRDVANENSPKGTLIKTQFNAITAENAMKWDAINPKPGEYRFEDADKFVEFGTKNGLFIIGHTLVWHSQAPKWIFEDANGAPLTRDALLARMREHIQIVVGRYKGRVQAWDVVNEALAEDGSLRDSPWRKIIGDDYIVKAFEFAREADPAAELYYNDYSIENPAKRAGAVKLLKKLKESGVRIDAVGIQEHVSLKWPTLEYLDATITAFGQLGLKVMITELDVNVLPDTKNAGIADVGLREKADPALDPYTDGLPDEMQQKLARRYTDLFGVYLKHRDVVSRVTFWGVNDGDSWLNSWPIKGRTSHPLLFDRKNQPKLAFDAVIKLAE
jgi:xylan 1,4-beta-xylosidase